MIRYTTQLFISLSFFILSTLPACVPIAPTGNSTAANTAASSPDQIFYDQAFRSNARSIRLLLPDGVLWSSALRIGDPTPLVLAFDILELGENISTDYRAKLIHCNADWRKSNLSNIDFLFEYNEFPITNEAFSYNTKVPYTQYRMSVPRVKLPGNYIISVYEDGNEANVVLTKRLMVYDQMMGVGAEVIQSSGVTERVTSHQIEFFVDYGSVDIPNPLEDIYVVVRQNNRWFNAIEGLEPTFVRQERQQLEYQHFDLQNNFYAGNEYRFFDLRTLNALGQNVGDIRRDQVPVEAFLLPDRNRSTELYSQYEDLNGAYVLGNLDIRGDELSADYVQTQFLLEANQKIAGDVYVVGAFNNRELTPENRMVYDSTLKSYTADLLLKQGFYNYQYYVVDSQDDYPYPFEGSYFEVESEYDILVYTRPIGTRGDILAGYTRISSQLGGR
ncbi:DUF5103 domain-containing protein [Tunicatimonas pelagia]|uniref:type IX secretion system plug protein n=1 Tax=Tunicatimonas pelagia TaxID=931531 RepID=UPI002666221E|nr:DUF5103 domain-containing protein [Tunicatimonas pelagia]WKN41107.1 DUF5103 domain-containing protein [Tunicatimonas pelagia]